MNTSKQHPIRKNLTGNNEIVQLAQRGGVTTAFMRKFVREAIAIIEAGLLRDGIVKIHHFGTFRLSAPFQSASPQVIFQPAKNIRELVVQAYGPAIHTGSRISLPALMEKHLGLAAAPPLPSVDDKRKEKPVLEPFDIAEVFPDFIETVPPAFDFAEEGDETALATNAFTTEARSSEAITGQPVSTAPADAKPVHVDAENDKPPTFTLAEMLEETAPTPPIPSRVTSQREPAFTLPPPRRRRFAWYAGATAMVLFLLFFLWPASISEKKDGAPRSVVSTTLNRLENPSVPSQATNDKPLAAPISTTPKKPAPFFLGGTHRVALGDKLWALSGTYYRDPYLWPNIYRVNTTAIQNPDVLERDQQLVLPILYGPPEKLTSEDRRHLAEGYFLLYRHYRNHDPALAPFALWAAVRYDARIKTAYAAELREDDLAFLEAHEVTRQVAER